jgi:hypothetical protein
VEAAGCKVGGAAERCFSRRAGLSDGYIFCVGGAESGTVSDKKDIGSMGSAKSSHCELFV